MNGSFVLFNNQFSAGRGISEVRIKSLNGNSVRLFLIKFIASEFLFSLIAQAKR